MSRQLKDWALLGSASNSSVTLRVFKRDGALAGSFVVTPSTAPTFAANCAWGGTGWSEDFLAAEVISVANGHVYGAPVKTASILTASTGQDLVANYNLGQLPLSKDSDPKPTITT